MRFFGSFIDRNLVPYYNISNEKRAEIYIFTYDFVATEVMCKIKKGKRRL